MKSIRIAVVSVVCLSLAAVLVGCQLADADPDAPPPTPAELLSDQIMPVDQLRPGMTGYGLTVFHGARPEKFGVEIISVLRNWDPQAHMILIRCSGQNLEKTGIAAGMSGSPIYIDGKLIGALAYGWSFTVEPIAGVQPIEQMLQTSGMHQDVPPADQEDLPDWTETSRAAPPRGPLLASVLTGDNVADAEGETRSAADLWRRVRDGVAPRGAYRSPGRGNPDQHLRPLATPLMVSGGSPAVMRLLRHRLAGTGMVPVQSGAASAGDPRLKDARLEPGGTVTIPLLRGDMDLSALGTVTAVAGDRVLAFGHPMYAEGPVNLPMATGIVHTFIPSMQSSFKLGSAGTVKGAVRRDENYAIMGVSGQVPAMTPMTVKVSHWTGEPKTYRYELADDWYFSTMMAEAATYYSVSADHGMPVDLNLRYKGRVKFRNFPEYTFQGTGDGFYALMDLLARVSYPIDAMMNNRWGKAFVESIDLEIEATNKQRMAYVQQARIKTDHLAPGEPAEVHLKMIRFRQEPIERAFTIPLPDDLPDGNYRLSLLDADSYIRLQAEHDVRKFNPQDMNELLATYQRLADPDNDRLYAVLTLPGGGVATRDQRLPELPGSRLAIMQQSGRHNFYPFVEDRTIELPLGRPVGGSAVWQIRIDRDKGKQP